MKRPPVLPRGPQHGVALLEVLVAMLIFSIGLLGLLGLQARAISLSTDAEDRNRAALLANEIASTMWTTRSVSGIATGAGSAWQTRVADVSKDGLPDAQLTVTPDATNNSADILITWRPASRADTNRSQLRTRVVLSL